jgi:molybdopterin/thiamine biosynthesis adenylyltransferase
MTEIDKKIRLMMNGTRFLIIGAGGIGSHLAEPLARFLTFSGVEGSLVIVDGDSFAEKNFSRQKFSAQGLNSNKAEHLSEMLAKEFYDQGSICFEAVSEYASGKNIEKIIMEKDVVFLAVDNHSTRKLVSDRAGKMQDIIVITGGNDSVDDPGKGTDGNVHIYVKKGGEELTHPITHLHPEIESADDMNPADLGCEELAASGSAQIIVTNLAVGIAMLEAFFGLVCNEQKPLYEELYLNILSGRCRPVIRTK